MRCLVAAIACRNNGSRLYGKPLQNLDIRAGITILDVLIDGLLTVDALDSIVLGVSSGPANLVFADFAKARELEYTFGCEEDVLSRLIACAEKVSATDVLRVTSESPFCFVDGITEAWQNHVGNNHDATFLDDVIDGCGFEIISLQALKKSHELGASRHRSELCSLYIRENKHAFKIGYMAPPEYLRRHDLRLTVDNPEDLIVCRKIFDEFRDMIPKPDLEKIVLYLDDNPFLKKLVLPYCETGYQSMYL